MIIKRTIEIDYGHTLPNHFSFCNQIHGHRGVITAHVQGEMIKKSGDSSEGMVIDFKIVKELMMKNIHDVLDHGFAIWIEDKRPIAVDYFIQDGSATGRKTTIHLSTLNFIKARNEKMLITQNPPTAEHLAQWAFFTLYPLLEEHKVKLVNVDWQETPSSVASYSFIDYEKDN